MLREKGWVTDMTAKRNLRAYKGMTIRNIKVYAKDKIALLLSMLTQIIVLGLFLLFLKNNYIDVINDRLGGLKDLLDRSDIEAIVNAWLIAGVVGTSVVTAALNALSVMVHDKMERIDYDYSAAAVKGRTVVLAYFSGATLSAFITASILLTAGLIFLAVSGSFLYTVWEVLLLYAIVLLGSVSSTMVLMLFVSFFKKDSTLSAFGILVSVAIGFVVGAYMPVGQFSEKVQTVVNLVPGSQITALLRNTLMQPAIDNADKILNGADGHQFAASLGDLFALKLNIFHNEVNIHFMVLYSLAAIAVFTVLNIALFRLSSKRKD